MLINKNPLENVVWKMSAICFDFNVFEYLTGCLSSNDTGDTEVPGTAKTYLSSHTHFPG